MSRPDTFDLRLLKTDEAADLVGLSRRTLETSHLWHRAYRKLGGRVVYAVEDLREWADRGLKSSTSDPGVGRVYPARPLNKLSAKG